MFIGHFAVALGAKKYAPGVSLGVLFLAGQLADLIWPNLVIAGVESFSIEPGITAMTPLDFTYYPYSHSLVALATWAAAFALLYALLVRAGTRVTLIIVAVALSHWVLDVATHRPDVPVDVGNKILVGFGLWNIPAVAVPLELLLFGLGTWLYARATRALDRRGSVGLWALVIFLLAVYAANVFAPPPPSTMAVAWSAQAMWLIVLWGYWIDRHRAPKTLGAAA